nr:ATP-binding cassette domain-containing protein [Agrobacterium vitis]
MSELDINDITKDFGSARVLHPVSLTVEKGEFVTILGPSGCGKSTLLRILMGISEASSGEIRLAGKRIDKLAPEARDIAMVFQSYALFPHMSVAKNLGFGLKMKNVPKDERARRIAHVLEIFILAPVIIPGLVVAVGIGQVFLALGLAYSVAGVIIVQIVGTLPLMIRLMTATLETIPDELIHAARSLGAGTVGIVAHIILPLAVPGLLAGGLMSFIGSFEEFDKSFIVGAPVVQTLPIKLYMCISIPIRCSCRWPPSFPSSCFCQPSSSSSSPVASCATI